MEAGQELAGRYRLDRRLGGGMGEAWSATDLMLDRVVAVKLVLADTAGEEREGALAWLRRAGKAAARIRHPHVAVIHDAGMHGAHPYLVMEFIRGPDLRKLLGSAPGGLPAEVVLEYGAQAAEGLAAAHAAGVVHRDVKPASLLLDQDGRVKVCGFGIAALAGGTAVTGEAGAVPGTLAYMAPEQLRAQPVTGAADVYALGATLFQLITGRVPFPGEDPRVVMAKILTDPPPAPGTLRPRVPPPLDAYLLSMLAKNPGDRPAMDSVPAALRRIASVPRAWAGALLAEAEGLLPSGSRLLAAIAGAWASWDADAAERTAGRVRDPLTRAKALLEVARAVEASDQARAARLLGAAEHAARAMPGDALSRGKGTLAGVKQVRILEKIAIAVAARDPAEAVSIACSLPDEIPDEKEPDWAIREESSQQKALRQIAGVAAERHPDVARRIACGIDGNPYSRALALCAVAGTAVKRDPGRSATFVSGAEKAVRELPAANGLRVTGLTEIAGILIEADPGRARRLLAEAEGTERSLGDEIAMSDDLAWVTYGNDRPDRLLELVKTMAKLDIAEALRIADAMDHGREERRTAVAVIAASRDPALAQSIAAAIGEENSPNCSIGIFLKPIDALTSTAWEMIGRAPERAAALLAEAEVLLELARVEGMPPQDVRSSLRKIGRVLARIDPAGAERIAGSFGDEPRDRARLLSLAARACRDQDPARAARLLADAERDARRIHGPADRARALIDIVVTQAGPLAPGTQR